MGAEYAYPACLVAIGDKFFTQNLQVFGKIGKFRREADGMPVSSHQFTHRGAEADPGQTLVYVGDDGVTPIPGAFHVTRHLHSLYEGSRYAENVEKEAGTVNAGSGLTMAPFRQLLQLQRSHDSLGSVRVDCTDFLAHIRFGRNLFLIPIV